MEKETTMTDWRALCVQMLNAWDKGDDISGPMNIARAALSEQQEKVSDQAWLDLIDDCDMDRFEGERVSSDGRKIFEAWNHQLLGEAVADAWADDEAQQPPGWPRVTEQRVSSDGTKLMKDAENNFWPMHLGPAALHTILRL